MVKKEDRITKEFRHRALALEELLRREINETDRLRHKIEQATTRLYEIAAGRGEPSRIAFETIKLLGE